MVYTYDVDGNFSRHFRHLLALSFALAMRILLIGVLVFTCAQLQMTKISYGKTDEFYNAFQLMNDISASLTASGNDHLYAKIQAPLIRMHHLLHRQGHAVISRAM